MGQRHPRVARLTVTILFAAVSGAVCLGEQLEFDAASVKLMDPSYPSLSPAGGPGTSSPTRYSARVWLVDLVKAAYGLSDDEISGGPNWMRPASNSNLYEIDARMSAMTTKEGFKEMLQTLLARRFHLVVHRSSQEFPAFELVVTKTGAKLRRAVPSSPGPPVPDGNNAQRMSAQRPPSTDQDGFPILPLGPHVGQILWNGVLKCRFQEKTLSEFAAVLGAMIYRGVGPSFGPKRPRVADKTGLNGTYNFTLEFACGGCVAAAPAGDTTSIGASLAGGEGPSIFAALENQLGLKAVRVHDVPVEMLVLDNVDRIPTPN